MCVICVCDDSLGQQSSILDDQVAEVDWNVSKLLGGVGLWCLIPPLGNHKLIDQVCGRVD